MQTGVMVLVPDTDSTYITTLTSFNAFNYTLYITRNNETQVLVNISNTATSIISRNSNNTGFVLQMRPVAGTDQVCTAYRM